MKDTTKSSFLLKEVPKRFEQLKAEQQANFGVMTPHHMVEHLIITIKGTAKKYEGERISPPNKRQVGFQNFIRNGCVMEHRLSDKTAADLPDLKYQSLTEAVAVIPESIQRFYNFWEANPDYIPYNNFMGALSFEALEVFHFNHFQYHLWQFGLLENYPFTI